MALGMKVSTGWCSTAPMRSTVLLYDLLLPRLLLLMSPWSLRIPLCRYYSLLRHCCCLPPYPCCCFLCHSIMCAILHCPQCLHTCTQLALIHLSITTFVVTGPVAKSAVLPRELTKIQRKPLLEDDQMTAHRQAEALVALLEQHGLSEDKSNLEPARRNGAQYSSCQN